MSQLIEVRLPENLDNIGEFSEDPDIGDVEMKGICTTTVPNEVGKT